MSRQGETEESWDSPWPVVVEVRGTMSTRSLQSVWSLRGPCGGTRSSPLNFVTLYARSRCGEGEAEPPASSV